MTGKFILVDDEGWSSYVLFRSLREAFDRAKWYFTRYTWHHVNVFHIYEIDEQIDAIIRILTIHRDGEIEEY